MLELDYEEMVNFIFSSLLKKGIGATKDDIHLILDLEMDYLIDNGFATREEE